MLRSQNLLKPSQTPVNSWGKQAKNLVCKKPSQTRKRFCFTFFGFIISSVSVSFRAMSKSTGASNVNIGAINHYV